MLQTHAMSLIYDYDPVPQPFYFAGYKNPLIKVESQAAGRYDPGSQRYQEEVRTAC